MIVLAEVNLLDVPALMQIPEVEMVAVL